MKTLREAILTIDKTLRGFAMKDALLIGVEIRSSSPLRITRDPATCQSVNTPGLYTAGEGAGYAGGIISGSGGRDAGGGDDFEGVNLSEVKNVVLANLRL